MHKYLLLCANREDLEMESIEVFDPRNPYLTGREVVGMCVLSCLSCG